MTTNRDFKTLVRARMHKTGETYSAARRHLLGQRAKPPSLFDAVAADDLERALVALALDGQPTGQVWTVWTAVDRLVGRSQEAVEDGRLDSLLAFVFETEGFSSPAEYDDPRLVQIDRVIARRLGTPAALAGLLLLLAKRLGMALRPVDFPGHFLVSDEEGTLYDPASGRALPRAPLMELVQDAFPERAATAFTPCGTRGLVTRLLENRLTARAGRGDGGGALLTSDQLLTLTDEPDARLRRGVLLWSMGAPEAGRAEVLSALQTPSAGVCS